MPSHYRLTPNALDDLDGIWSFIAAESPDAANRVQSAILDACELLGRYPLLARGELTLPLTTSDSGLLQGSTAMWWFTTPKQSPSRS